MAKTSKKAIGTAMAGVMAVGAVAGAVQTVNVANAAESAALKEAKANVDHLINSINKNYAGIKNQSTWELYVKTIKSLIAKIPSAEKAQAAELTEKTNKIADVVVAIGNINNVEKSIETNFNGIKNASTWNGYLEVALEKMKSVDKSVFQAKYDELVERYNKVDAKVEAIIEKHNTDLKAAEALYDAAVKSKSLADAQKALAAAEALGTHSTSDALEAKVNALIAEINSVPAVTSVVAVNGSTVNVTFNKAIKKSTVIDSADDTLVTGVFANAIEVGGYTPNFALLDAKKAELSQDGKTLTIYMAAQLEGNYLFDIAQDKILTEDGKKAFAASTTKYSIKDTTRASVESVVAYSKYEFDINLSEPIASNGAITAKYADDSSSVTITGTTPEKNNKTIRVVLDPTTTVGKNIVITIPSLTDYAGNISAPITQTVQVSDADKTAPTIASAVATSNTTVDVTFSEPVQIKDDTKFVFNGTDLVAGKVVAKTGDTTKTKFTVTVASTTTVATLAVKDGAVEDFAGNAIKADSKLVSFAADKTAPTITSAAVKTISGADYLVLDFSEKVTLKGSTVLTFKYINEYGVEVKSDIAAADITANGTEDKSFKVALASATPSLKSGANYSVEIAKGYFADLFDNDIEKNTVNFVNSASASVSTKLVATINVTDNVDAKDGRYVTVNFDKAVDSASATNVSNYTVENSTVKSVKLISNDNSGAVAQVYLTPDTIKIDGMYKVTVKGVKGYTSSITTMDETTKSVTLKENVAAKLKSKELTFVTSTSTTVKLTFDENITNGVGVNDDYELYIDGKKSTKAVTTSSVAGGLATLTILEDLSSDIAAGKKIVLKATEGFDIADSNSNTASKADVVLN